VYHRTNPELKALLKEYREKFGDGYPIDYIGARDAPTRIRTCIDTNMPVPLSEYEDLLGFPM